MKHVRTLLARGGLVFFAVVLMALIVRAWMITPSISLRSIAENEPFDLPTGAFFFPDDPTRVAVTEKTGRIKWLYVHSSTAEGIMLDLSKQVYAEGHEEGLLSVAFDPNFHQGGYIYVFYNLPKPLRSRISRFTVDEDLHADPDSELPILEIVKPDKTHNGGMLLFGHDGYLYGSIGDGSLKRDKRPLLQTRQTLLGTIIRIDVRDATIAQPYRIPPDNPFVGRQDGSRQEIWAYGFRNPWRFSFDRMTHELYVGDVGDTRREEINRVEKGGNYGWALMEGDLCMPPETSQCHSAGTVPPLATFPRWFSRSVTGGYVYRGSDIPWLKGQYVFGDFLKGIFSLPTSPRKDPMTLPSVLLHKHPTDHGPNKGRTMLFSAFAEDRAGELYVVNIEGGFYRIEDLGALGILKGFLYAFLNFR